MLHDLTTLCNGTFYASRGYVVALPLVNGKHFTYQDDDEFPWIKWNNDFLSWMAENIGKENWQSLSKSRFQDQERYIIFKNKDDALKWKLMWL
jgi:hypothetical protein